MYTVYLQAVPDCASITKNDFLYRGMTNVPPKSIAIFDGGATGTLLKYNLYFHL